MVMFSLQKVKGDDKNVCMNNRDEKRRRERKERKGGYESVLSLLSYVCIISIIIIHTMCLCSAFRYSSSFSGLSKCNRINNGNRIHIYSETSMRKEFKKES